MDESVNLFLHDSLVATLHLMGNNMSRSIYSKIETGTRNIRISDFLVLKQIYGVDFSEFFIVLLPDSEK